MCPDELVPTAIAAAQLLTSQIAGLHVHIRYIIDEKSDKFSQTGR